ncbi:MAG: EAL domain-containing protein [Bacillota bacterium]
MRAIRFRIMGLLVIGAALELVLGLSIYALPQEYRLPIFDSLRPHFGYLSASLMAGGVVLLVMVRYPLHPWMQRAMALFAALPLGVMAARFAAAGLNNAPWSWGLLAVAIAVAPWLPTHPNARLRLSLTTLGVTQMIMGLLIVLMPAIYAGPLSSPFQGWERWSGGLQLVSGLAVLLVRTGERGSRQAMLAVLSMLFPLAATFNTWSVGMLSGTILWGIWCATLTGVLWRALVGSSTLRDIEPPEPAEDSAAESERLLELWSWILLLVILMVSLIGGPGSIASPVIIHLFILLVSGYNAVAYFLFPKVGRSDQRVLTHLTFLVFAVSFLLVDGGRLAFVISALMVTPPFVATRVRGARTGYAMLGVVVGSVVLFQLLHWFVGGQPLVHALNEAAVQILVIVTAGIVGIRSAAEQHQLVRELAGARAHLQRQLQQQALVSRIGQAIRSTLDLDEILTTTVNELGRALQVSRCFIRLRGEEGFVPVIHQYVARGVFPLTEDHLPNLQLSQVVAEVGQAVVINDILRHPIWKEIGPVGGTQAALAAPIYAEGELLGVITFHQCDQPRVWKPEEVQFLEAVAGQVGLAMAHARAHGDLELQHEELKYTHRHLQSQGEELEAQREELQAQNDALVEQGALLARQARQLEAALLAARIAEEAQARLVAIMEATTDFVGLTDRRGKVLHLNRAARSELGIDGSGEIPINIQEVFSPSFVEQRMFVALRTAMRHGTWNGEGAVRGAGGREIPVSLVILVHRDQMGELFFATIARDISSQKLAQAALRDSEERFRSAFGSAPIGMGLIGSHGRWMQVNRPLCEMLGFSEDELLQMHVRRLVHPDDMETATTYTVQMNASEIRSYQMEQRWFHKFGHVVWTQVAVSIVRTSEAENIYYVVHVQDITERKRVEGQLIHLANFDPLTNLYNRRRFQEELERQLVDSARYGTRGALLFIDLDQFKYINDSLGHQAGDRMLKSLATLLRNQLRESDAIARLGGDEFAVLLPHADGRQAEAVAQKLLEALRRHVELIDGRTVSITGSMGIALFPEHGRTAEQLLAYADMAMYQVKEVGRNSFTLYTPDETMRLQWESKLTWERRILDALEHDRFVLYHQPILCLTTGEIGRYEALLRMKGDDGEVISPGGFLSVAERFGLIHAIDRWVVKEAIHQIARARNSHPGFCLEVNLSGKAFGDPELLPLIKREIAATGIDPSALVLEITETAACTDTVLGREFVTTLREMGCRFALDDFGSGFSSFSYLKHLPVDYLKIDGGFIRNLARDSMDQDLVRAMVQVAKGLGRKTIAEWVEDRETLALLRELGVDYAQGYHIGRPMPMDTTSR